MLGKLLNSIYSKVLLQGIACQTPVLPGTQDEVGGPGALPGCMEALSQCPRGSYVRWRTLGTREYRFLCFILFLHINIYVKPALLRRWWNKAWNHNETVQPDILQILLSEENAEREISLEGKGNIKVFPKLWEGSFVEERRNTGQECSNKAFREGKVDNF